jgi:TonB family protein
MARFLALAFAASGILHGVAYASLGLAPHERRAVLPPSSVAFEVREAEPFQTKAEPPKPMPSDEPKPAPQRAPVPAAAPKTTQEPAPARAPVDLSGVTLTNADGAGGFAMPTGDGSDRAGPLGPLGAKPVASASAKAVEPVASIAPARAAELVAPQDLSERPRPPSLDGALRALYPDEARRRAISGTASLRVRIGPDGRVQKAAMLSESFPGFGDACRKAVLGSRWTAPRDRDGRTVQTEVRYTCLFVVD